MNEIAKEIRGCQERPSYQILTLWCFHPQTVVPGNRNNAMLQNLLPDTPYNITVEAVYAEGPGGSLNGNGRTGEAATGAARVAPLQCVRSRKEFKSGGIASRLHRWCSESSWSGAAPVLCQHRMRSGTRLRVGPLCVVSTLSPTHNRSSSAPKTQENRLEA